MCINRYQFTRLFAVAICLMIVTPRVLALSLVCGTPKSSELNLPNDYIKWEIEEDDRLGVYYSFKIRSAIDQVELQDLALLRRNGEKLDFLVHINYLDHREFIGEGHSAVEGAFSLSKDILKGVEFIAVYNRQYENCVPETRKYIIEIPHNK